MIPNFIYFVKELLQIPLVFSCTRTLTFSQQQIVYLTLLTHSGVRTVCSTRLVYFSIEKKKKQGLWKRIITVIMSQEIANEDEYELNIPPFVCLIMSVIACFLYVFGSNDKRLWSRNARDHRVGKWNFNLILWLLFKSCLLYIISTVLTAVVSVYSVVALRNQDILIFYEKHGLTVILAMQLVLYNVLCFYVFIGYMTKKSS